MKNKKVLGIAALAAVTAVGGSFAYFNQTMTATNPFNTGTYDSNMQEVFNPADGENWEPGVTVNKQVSVTNTGTQPIVVRVRFDETWTRKDETTPYVTIKGEDKTADGEVKITTPNQLDMADGEVDEKDGNGDVTATDDTVVAKELLNAEKWVLGSDGWYYYVDVLAGRDGDTAGGTTGTFLNTVTLDKDLDMGNIETKYFYSVTYKDPTKAPVENGNVADLEVDCLDPATDKDGNVIDGKYDINLSKLSEALGLVKGDVLTTDIKVGAEDGKLGYSNSNYALTITSQTVQTTEAAVKDLFPGAYDGENLLEGLNWNLTE